jgi:hypothetical protein
MKGLITRTFLIKRFIRHFLAKYLIAKLVLANIPVSIMFPEYP